MASRKAAIVPSKLQFAGESVYAYVRNELGKDIIAMNLCASCHIYSRSLHLFW
jgi:hypothetical protein